MDQPRARSAAKSRAVRAAFFDAIAVKRESISSRSKAFSSEVETGSRRENASNQEARAPFRFNRNGGFGANTALASRSCELGGHGRPRRENLTLQPTPRGERHNPFVLVNYSPTICLNPPLLIPGGEDWP